MLCCTRVASWRGLESAGLNSYAAPPFQVLRHINNYPENRFMISNAYAQTAAAAGPEGSLLTMLPILLMFVVLYFLMIRPQMKKAKEQKSMVESLKKGDEVIAMGIIGKIVKVSDGYVSIDVGDGKLIHMQKQAVATLLPTGTFNDVTK
jgi:preprotein translocase subunit YajC